MSRLQAAGVVAVAVVGVLAAEHRSPGITLLTVAVLAEVGQRIVQAAVWPLGAGALVWIGWRVGRHTGRRDTLQEVAEAAGRDLGVRGRVLRGPWGDAS